MDSIIIGTAGHIDHGKTALVKALTGHDTDTLAEEKKRGISINLGFTNIELPNGRILGIVDVPGHERFIRNMLAGATGIDVALIVIAANEGIMPQTQEHMDILSFLDIQKSIIVLTKIDMVEEDFKELVIEDIKESIQGTFLEGTKVIEVDSISGVGIPSLIAELEEQTTNIRKRSFSKKPRMNIDRVFSVKGYGTVVTGTLMEGKINIDDEMVIYPEGILTKVRNLQVHDKNVSFAYAGQRTAINLSNVGVDQIKRGFTAAAKDSVYVTDLIDVKFSIVKNTKFEINKFYKLKIYIGSSEEVARFVPITHNKVTAGDEGYAQILLDHKITVLKGDRFVLRSITPVTTIGGGFVVDPSPVRYKKITEEILRSIQLKDSASLPEMIEEYIKNNPFSNFDKLKAFLNKDLNSDELVQLAVNGFIAEFDKEYVHVEYLAHLQYMIEIQLNDYHAKFPLRKGIPKAELLEKLNQTDKKKNERILQYFIEKKVIKLEQNMLSLYNFNPILNKRQSDLKDELENIVIKNGYTIQSMKDLIEDNKEKHQILEYLVQDRFIVLPGQYILHRDLYDKAKEIASNIFLKHGILKLSNFRDSIGTSRKYALMILEKFDQERFTRRQGEDRVLSMKNK